MYDRKITETGWILIGSYASHRRRFLSVYLIQKKHFRIFGFSGYGLIVSDRNDQILSHPRNGLSAVPVNDAPPAICDYGVGNHHSPFDVSLPSS